MSHWLALLVAGGLLLVSEVVPAQGARRQPPMALPADVAALDALSVVLGRPTDRGVTASVLAADTREAYLEYGPADAGWPHRTETVTLRPGEPRELALQGLAPGSRVQYRLRHRAPGSTAFDTGSVQFTHTQRLPGQAFHFQLQGDSHPERAHQFHPALYAQTLRAVAQDRPDFYLTLGDDFSVDTLPQITEATVTQRYRLQRPFLALVGQAAPLFLVNGNHEQASAANLDGSADNVAVWAQNARNRHFPQPAPDAFYTGDTLVVPHIGLLRDYHAWTWGDALFVIIDPYWHSPQHVDNAPGPARGSRGDDARRQRDLWGITLGEQQYRWLRQTLEGSRARFKFVFSHHVLGTGRGGIEMADLYEWGGRSRRGLDEFVQRRPQWQEPIHALMARTGVSIFFQGHDHVFAHQEKDGVVYQTLPHPADPNYVLNFPQAYRQGQVLPGSGRLRVQVTPERVRVEYVRSWLPEHATPEHPDGEVAYWYELKARSVP